MATGPGGPQCPTSVGVTFCFPLSLRIGEEMLALRGILVSHRTWGHH